MENASTGQRDGKTPAFAFALAGKRDMIEMLEGLDLAGPAAFERDCLSFMLDGWPSYPGAATSEECFTLEDVKAQIIDLIASSPQDEDLRRVVDQVSRTIAQTAATSQ